MQTGTNYTVRIARETTEGVAALVGAAALLLRAAPSPGMELKRNRITSNTRRADGLKDSDRLGFKTVDGSFDFDVTMGGVTDMLIEAIMRSTWSAEAILTTATGAGACIDLTANDVHQITRTGSGSFITDGWKEGDIARLAGYSTAANNSLNLRVVEVAVNTLTFAGTPLTVGAADVACTLTRLKKVITATEPTKYSHTIEQYEKDNDLSKLFLGCKCVGFKISLKPGEMATYTATFIGMDRTLLVGGTSPWFTTPIATTGLGLIADESLIWINGAVGAYITGFDLEFQITAGGKPVIGSFVSPAVFDNDMMASGNITLMRTSAANDILFDGETEFEIGISLVEPLLAGSVYQSILNFWFPRVKFASSSSSLGGDGPMPEAHDLIISPAVYAPTVPASIAAISSSAA